MHHRIQTIDGPEFLDAVADAEAANGNDINAQAFRERAAQRSSDRQRLRAARERADELAQQLEDARRALRVA